MKPKLVMLLFDPQSTGHHPEYLKRFWLDAVRDDRPLRMMVHPAVAEQLRQLGGASDIRSITAIPENLIAPDNRLPDQKLAVRQMEWVGEVCVEWSSGRVVEWLSGGGEKLSSRVVEWLSGGGGKETPTTVQPDNSTTQRLNDSTPPQPDNSTTPQLHNSTTPPSLFLPRLNAYLRALVVCGGVGVPVAGILFGPRAASWCYPGGTVADRLHGIREVWRLWRLKKRAGLHSLFLLNDARTAAWLQKWIRLPGGVHRMEDPMPEKITPRRSPEEIRAGLGIAADEKVYLLIGALREGKGVREMLRHFASRIPAQGTRERLLISGNPVAEFREFIGNAERAFQPKSPNVKLTVELRQLSDEEFAERMVIADVVLLHYRNIWNSSGILNHARLHNKKIWGTDKGLLGELVGHASSS